MGNTESAKKKQQLKTATRRIPEPSEAKKLIDTMNVLLLHKSDAKQLQIVRNFRDGLIAKTEGTVEVTDFINIAHECKIPHNLAWLNDLNNVVLLCLTPDAMDQFEKIILEKGFADENGDLHKKVFSVVFGEKLAEWPPRGLKKGSTDLRDFHFGFSDVENLRPEDFEKSLRVNSLIAAIKATR